MKTRYLLTAGVAGLCLMSAAAQATYVGLWDYTVTTVWSGPSTFTGPGGGAAGLIDDQVSDPDVISWGASGGSYTAPTGDPNQDRSALEINNSPTNGQVVTNGGPAPTNTITHYNNAISGNFDTLTAASLQTTLTLTPILPPIPPGTPGTPQGPFSTTFTVDFIETLNQSPCGFPSTSVCDDIFVLTAGSLDFTFDYEGTSYATTISEVTGNLGPLSNSSCAEAGAPSGCVGFQTQEGLANNVQFQFAIREVPVPVPAPGPLALMGVGLLGLGAARRFRPAC